MDWIGLDRKAPRLHTRKRASSSRTGGFMCVTITRLLLDFVHALTALSKYSTTMSRVYFNHRQITQPIHRSK